MLVFIISQEMFLLPSWSAFWNKESELQQITNMIHSAFSVCMDLQLLRLWSCSQVSLHPLDCNKEFIYEIQTTGLGPLQIWLHWLCDTWCLKASLHSVFLEQYLSTQLRTLQKWGLQAMETWVWCDVCKVTNRAGMENKRQLSTLPCPTKSWRHPRKLCGSSKKKQMKYLCTQPIPNFFDAGCCEN